MRFFVAAATAALFGTVFAAPALTPNPDPRETVVLEDFKAVQSVGGPVTEISFKLFSHREVGVLGFVCKGANVAGLGTETYNCNNKEENDAYRFSLRSNKESTFNMTVFHQTAPAFGFWGHVNVVASCSADDKVSTCTKPEEFNAELHVYE